MVDREDLGSWLEGPRARAERAGGDLGYRGERLGLPEHGPGSLASFGQRVVAFLVDSVMCGLVAYGLFRDTAYATPVFALEVLVLTLFAGASAGQRIRGLRVVRLDGTPIGVSRVLLRTVLLLLLVPALIWDRDGRGLHDRAAGTAVLHAR
jgi:uncharacterized RDD family membrane protein YckC